MGGSLFILSSLSRGILVCWKERSRKYRMAAADVFIPEDYVRSRYGRRTSSRVESPYGTDYKNQSPPQSPPHHKLNHNGDFASNSFAARCTSIISGSIMSGGGFWSGETIILNCLTP